MRRRMGALLCWKQPAGSMKSWPPVVTSPMATALGGPLWALHRHLDRWAGRLQRYFGRTEMVSWLSVVPKFLWIGPVHHPWRLLMDPSHHPHRAAGCPVHHPWGRRYITHGSAPLAPGKAARNTRARFNFSFFNYSISLTGPQLHKLREDKKCRPPACVSASRRAVPLRGPALCWEGPPVPKWMTKGLRPRALRALHPTRCPEGEPGQPQLVFATTEARKGCLGDFLRQSRGLGCLQEHRGLVGRSQPGWGSGGEVRTARAAAVHSRAVGGDFSTARGRGAALR